MSELVIRSLCEKYSDMQAEDIDEIIKESNIVEKSSRYQMEDVFIDILSDVVNEAIVVYHRTPRLKESIYKEIVVGKIAKRLNEPGVYRTFETSLKTEGLLAKTQENRLIRQKVFPIRSNQRTVAVLIIESPVEENVESGYYLFDGIESKASKVFTQDNHSSSFYYSLINNLDEAVLIFDKDGVLRENNEVAESYYYHFGYMEKILGFHYDNLSLDTSTFEQLQYLWRMDKWHEVGTGHIYFGSTHFKMKRFFEKDGDVFIMILHDKTEIYNKEVEIIAKSVAIKEIHHRVKNNLQSIVSLLRIQGRRSDNQQVKKLLRESEARILAISATHELLSKRIDDDVPLSSVLEMTINNVHRVFFESKFIQLEKDIDESIILDSDKTVTVALVVNELLQNSCEHGFDKKEKSNLIRVSVKHIENSTIDVIVQDNGKGYNPKASSQNSLGLQIVTSYVKEKLRGKLQIKSSKEGTTTRFYFKK